MTAHFRHFLAFFPCVALALLACAESKCESDQHGINGAVGYTYDPVGNRTQMTSSLAPVPAGLWNYDANDRFTDSDTGACPEREQRVEGPPPPIRQTPSFRDCLKCLITLVARIRASDQDASPERAQRVEGPSPSSRVQRPIHPLRDAPRVRACSFFSVLHSPLATSLPAAPPL